MLTFAASLTFVGCRGTLFTICLEIRDLLGNVACVMTVSDFVPVLIQIALAAGLAGVILTASVLFGQRGSKNKIKNYAYECGIKSDGKTSTRFSVKFYVTAMLFILFDIEVLFLIPWVLVYRDFVASSLPILGPILFFLGVLVVGLAYELKKGALEWEK